MSVRIEGEPVLNGIDIRRVGALIAGKQEVGATALEIDIATRIGRKIRKMHSQGYSAKDGAAYARKLVIDEAMKIKTREVDTCE